MLLSCSFNPLLSSLTDVSLVVEDALSSEDMKNIIFKITKDGKVQLVGLNHIIKYKAVLKESDYKLEAADTDYNDSGVIFMQIKSKELIAFLSAFRTMRRTKAETVNFEVVKNKVKTTVIEVETENESVEHTSTWMFDNLPIKPRSLDDINLSFSEEGAVDVQTEDIMKYTSSLIPILQSGGTGLYSKIIFGDDRVVAFNPAFNVLMVNAGLPDAFKGMAMSYRGASFMQSIICNYPSVEVNRTEMYICFKIDDVEAFISYDTNLAQYKMYLDLYKEDHAIQVDRQYMQDVLKRLSIGSDSIEFTIDVENNVIEVKNSKFNQTIPIDGMKGMDELGKVTFKIMPDVLNKMIIGDESKMQFNPNLAMYIVPNAKGSYVLNITDLSKAWFSTASIR